MKKKIRRFIRMINGQQQVLSNSTMPAMPKEKSTPVSLNESNFSELDKMKEQLMMATSAQSTIATSNNTTNATRYGAHGHNNLNHHHHHHQNHHQQTTTHHRNSVCGCGAASATIDTVNRVSTVLTANPQQTTASNGTTSCSSTINNIIAASPRGQQQQQQQHQPQQNIQLNLTDSNRLSSSSTSSTSSSSSTATTTSSTSTSSGAQSSTTTSSSSSTTTATANATASATCNPQQARAAVATPPKKSPNDFIFGKVIGEGSFSTVFLARDIHTKKEHAIKVCEKQHIIRERKQDYVRREREAMNIMTNVPGFVNLSCTFQDNRSLYFVMTLAKNGDLLPYINKVGSFDLDCTRHYAAELVLACENMHRRNIVHRDLKPENILLDENMHTLIADFGSAKILGERDSSSYSAAIVPPQVAAPSGGAAAVPTPSPSSSSSSSSTQSVRVSRPPNSTTMRPAINDDDVAEAAATIRSSPAAGAASNADDNISLVYLRRRKNSFVGTAQYVSPEVLQSHPIRHTADLWALGCIIYQMISGLPPFRGNNEFMIFKEILNGNLEFPEGFDRNAEDLVRKLLKLNPNERLGAHDRIGRYASIRSHPFFAGIDFDTIREQTPPKISPYLPGVTKDYDFHAYYRVPENLEPGLGDRQLTRLLGLELGTCMDSYEIEQKTVRKNIYDLSDEEKQKRLEQQKSDKWHPFAKGEVILKKGFVNKRKGLFARRRMLLLTTGPRLIYIDPVQMIEKGEIPWSSQLRVEPKNFKIFFVHTPDRTYYLDDPEGYSLQWVDAIEKVRKLTYKDQQDSSNNTKKSL